MGGERPDDGDGDGDHDDRPHGGVGQPGEVIDGGESCNDDADRPAHNIPREDADNRAKQCTRLQTPLRRDVLGV